MRLRQIKGPMWRMRLFRRAMAAMLVCLAALSAGIAVSVPNCCTGTL